jgi:hypothetical protein
MLMISLHEEYERPWVDGEPVPNLIGTTIKIEGNGDGLREVKFFGTDHKAMAEAFVTLVTKALA